MTKVPVTIFIDEGETVVGVRVVPLASDLATRAAATDGDGTSHATTKVTYNGGAVDAEADVSWDI